MNRGESPDAGAHGRAHGAPLGAEAEPIARVLDVGAHEDAPVLGLGREHVLAERVPVPGRGKTGIEILHWERSSEIQPR